MVSDASRRIVLIAAALGSSIAPFMVSAFIVALPAIGKEFSAGTEVLGWVTSVFFLAAAVFLVPIGRIADNSGIKRVFTAGIGVYVVSALLCILAPDITFLIFARFVTGIGAGMIFGTSIALISLVYPESERGKAIGINVMAMAVGFLLGFFLGGFLTFYLGWRSILIVTIPPGLFVVALILTRLRGECEVPKKRQHDLPGMVLFASTVLFLMAGFSLLPRSSGAALLVAGGIALVLFVLQERRAATPLLRLGELVRNRIFVRANITALLFNISNFAIIFLVSLYLQSVRVIDARVAGIILLVPIIFMAGLSSYAGRLSDRIPPRFVVGAGAGLTTLSLFILTFIGEDTPISLVIVSLILMGSGIALFQSPLVRTLLGSVPREMFGVSSGMVETMRLAGMTVSIAIALIIFTVAGSSASAASLPAGVFLASLHTTFPLLLVISLFAFGMALTLTRSEEQGAP